MSEQLDLLCLENLDAVQVVGGRNSRPDSEAVVSILLNHERDYTVGNIYGKVPGDAEPFSTTQSQLVTAAMREILGQWMCQVSPNFCSVCSQKSFLSWFWVITLHSEYCVFSSEIPLKRPFL